MLKDLICEARGGHFQDDGLVSMTTLSKTKWFKLASVRKEYGKCEEYFLA